MESGLQLVYGYTRSFFLAGAIDLRTKVRAVTDLERAKSAFWWSRLTLRCFAASFAIVGSQFLLWPEETVRFMNAVGAQLGDFTPAPASRLRFWLSLSTGYMALVTALAWMAQRDLPRRRDLVGLLALGKAVTSLTSLAFYITQSDAFIYLANFLVDGAITAGALWIWSVIPSLSRRGILAAEALPQPPLARDPVMIALMEAMVPAGGAFPEGARDSSAADGMEAFIGGAASERLDLVRLALKVFDASPFFLPPIRFRRFSRLPLDERIAVLEAWERSPLVVRRQPIHMLKLLVMSQFYSQSVVEAHLGYVRPLVRKPRQEAA